jgi:hypothetical protein
MSAGNPGRALRTRGSVDYTNDASDRQLEDALHTSEGGAVPLQMPGELPPVEDGAAQWSDWSDGYSSEGMSGWEDDDGRVHRSPGRKTASPEERAALENIAVQLGIPLGELKRVRSSCRYLYHTVCQGVNTTHRCRIALSKLLFKHGVSLADVETCVAYGVEIAQGIEVPRKEVDDTFAPHAKFVGGVFCKLGMHIADLFAIALVAIMLEKLREYRANGSAQLQGMSDVLSSIGLDNHAVAMLAGVHATDTPEDSARAEGQKVATQLNATPPMQRLSLLLSTLAGFPQLARTMQPSGYQPSRYDRSQFDTTRLKGARKIAENKGAANVACHILLPTKNSPGAINNTSMFACSALPDGCGVDQTSYMPFAKVLVGANRNWKDKIQAQGGDNQSFVITHRAHEFAYDPSPEALARVLQGLLMSTDESTSAQAPILKALLNKFGQPPVDEVQLGFFPLNPCYASVAFNNKFHRLCTKNVRGTTCQVPLRDEAIDSPQFWMQIDGATTMEEFLTIMLPPFKAFEYGSVDFYFAMSDVPPSGAFQCIDIDFARRYAFKRAWSKAKAKVMRCFMGRSNRVPNPEEQGKLDARLDEARDRVALEHPIGLITAEDLYGKDAWPTWHDKRLPDDVQWKDGSRFWRSYEGKLMRSARKARRKLRKRALENQDADDTFQKKLRALPGGTDARKAMASFAAAASASQVGESSGTTPPPVAAGSDSDDD